MAESKYQEADIYGKVLDEMLGTKWVARKHFWKARTDSSNTWAKEEAKKDAENVLNGALFIAEEQTAGKGRRGRVWTSPAGENVYMTLLLYGPGIQPDKASQLTLVMGLSVAQAAAEVTGKSAGIKWPNDVVFSGKKICGILTEMQIKEGKPEYIVIGVGINVNQKAFPEELSDKATSLLLETGREADRRIVVARTMDCFERNYELFLENQDLSLLKKEYEKLLLNMDREVRILEKQGESRGIARGITGQGELLIENPDGSMRKVFSGEVSVRGLYSYV